ncbi:MAG: discoidin domain-containing protein, partial [Candidatus Thermoplasmatota archaeon]|nr:discoidin domain-containing protein [Candidatus Thermoplasmatota archaeon]
MILTAMLLSGCFTISETASASALSNIYGILQTVTSPSNILNANIRFMAQTGEYRLISSLIDLLNTSSLISFSINDRSIEPVRIRFVKSFIDSKFALPAFYIDNKEQAIIIGSDYYEIRFTPVIDTWSVKVNESAVPFDISKILAGTRTFGKGSASSILLSRAEGMWIRLSQHDGNGGIFTFMPATGRSNYGCPVSFSKSWLSATFGITHPFFEWGDSKPRMLLKYTENATHYTITPEHFSVIGVHEAATGIITNGGRILCKEPVDDLFSTPAMVTASSEMGNITKGLSTTEGYPAPTLFDMNGILYAIVAGAGGSYSGWLYTNSGWISNTAIVSGISTPAEHSGITVFCKGGIWYCIVTVGNSGTAFYGFKWMGSTWASNASIVSGLISSQSHTKPSVFQMDGIYYLILGSAEGIYSGFEWMGSTWASNASIVSGLIAGSGWNYPSVFYKDSNWYAIIGKYNAISGFKWMGSTWASNASIVSGISISGSPQYPSVFYIYGTYCIIIGSWQKFYGYVWEGSAWTKNWLIKTNAKDDSTSTGWSPLPSNEPSAWIKFDAGSVKNISSCRIYWGSEVAFHPARYHIQVSSDNSTFYTVVTETSAPPASAWKKYGWLNYTNVRYIKLIIDQHGSSGTRVFECDYYQCSAFIPSRTSGLISEIDSCSFSTSYAYFASTTIKIPISTKVTGIVSVKNNAGNIYATNVTAINLLINNTYYYDAVNQFVYIGTNNVSQNKIINWTVSALYGSSFNITIAPKLVDVGFPLHCQGTIGDADGKMISGMMAYTDIYSGTEKIASGPIWNCTGGNYLSLIDTTSIAPGPYSIKISFTDSGTGTTFSTTKPIYIGKRDVTWDPDDPQYSSAWLYYTFFDSNSGTQLRDDIYKVYISSDATIEAADRVKGGKFPTYINQELFLQIRDYWDNTIYPAGGGTYQFRISNGETYLDIPIALRSFKVKNTNSSTVYFTMTQNSIRHSEWILPQEITSWYIGDGTYAITKQYYNSKTGAYQQTLNDNVAVSNDLFYWIRGYDLEDIIINIDASNASLANLILNVDINVDATNATIGALITNIQNKIEVVNSTVGEIYSNMIVNFDIVNSSIDWLNNTLLLKFDITNSNIDSLENSVLVAIDLSETNLTTLSNTIINALSVVDSVVDTINSYQVTHFAITDAKINSLNNTLLLKFDITNSNIDSLENSVLVAIDLSETNLTTLSNTII